MDRVIHFVNGKTIPRNSVIDIIHNTENARIRDVNTPLNGICFAVQNNICIEGSRLTCGSKVLKDYISPYSATAVQWLQEAGAIPVCTANMDEFGMGTTGRLSAFGIPENPSAIGCYTGGACSGAAALVAADCVPFSLASDSGGDARRAAAWCGVIGMKPSYGAYSRYGLAANASSLEQIALIGNDVQIMRNAHRCLSARKDQQDSTHIGLHPLKERFPERKRKIVIPSLLTDDTITVEDSIMKAQENAAQRLYELGCEISSRPMFRTSLIAAAYYAIACAEASSNLSRIMPLYSAECTKKGSWEERYIEYRENMGHEVKKRILAGAYVLQKENYSRCYLSAIVMKKKIKEWFSALFKECDLILLPVSSTTAQPIDEQVANIQAGYRAEALTACANLAGLPAISIPIGQDLFGRPLAVQCITPFGKDEWLFDTAEMLMDD